LGWLRFFNDLAAVGHYGIDCAHRGLRRVELDAVVVACGIDAHGHPAFTGLGQQRNADAVFANVDVAFATQRRHTVELRRLPTHFDIGADVDAGADVGDLVGPRFGPECLGAGAHALGVQLQVGIGLEKPKDLGAHPLRFRRLAAQPQVETAGVVEIDEQLGTAQDVEQLPVVFVAPVGVKAAAQRAGVGVQGSQRMEHRLGVFGLLGRVGWLVLGWLVLRGLGLVRFDLARFLLLGALAAQVGGAFEQDHRSRQRHHRQELAMEGVTAVGLGAQLGAQANGERTLLGRPLAEQIRHTGLGLVEPVVVVQGVPRRFWLAVGRVVERGQARQPVDRQATAKQRHRRRQVAREVQREVGHAVFAAEHHLALDGHVQRVEVQPYAAAKVGLGAVLAVGDLAFEEQDVGDLELHADARELDARRQPVGRFAFDKGWPDLEALDRGRCRHAVGQLERAVQADPRTAIGVAADAHLCHFEADAADADEPRLVQIGPAALEFDVAVAVDADLADDQCRPVDEIFGDVGGDRAGHEQAGVGTAAALDAKAVDGDVGER